MGVQSEIVCEARGRGTAEFAACPKRTCRANVDCWVAYGKPQQCICDPHFCGLVCLPGESFIYISLASLDTSLLFSSGIIELTGFQRQNACLDIRILPSTLSDEEMWRLWLEKVAYEGHTRSVELRCRSWLASGLAGPNRLVSGQLKERCVC